MEDRSTCLRAGELISHGIRTHMKHYGEWTDDASTKSAVEASIKSLVGAS